MISPTSLLRGWSTGADKALVLFVIVGLVASAFIIALIPEAPDDTLAEDVQGIESPCPSDLPDPRRFEHAPAPIEWPLRQLRPEERAIPEDAVFDERGIASVILRSGDELLEPPGVDDMVSVYQLGWTMEDGVPLNGLRSLPVAPTTFSLDKVIEGYATTVATMRPGERRRFWVPAHLAYGTKATGPRGNLVFEVELVSVSP